MTYALSFGGSKAFNHSISMNSIALGPLCPLKISYNIMKLLWYSCLLSLLLFLFIDVAETGSEAWSIDVLASDTESLRLAELDNEDSGSVAQSDDTTRR